MTLATLETRVKTRIRADMSTPAVNDLADESIATWANEKKSEVIHLLKDPVRFFPTLQVMGTALTFAAGVEDLPADYELYTNVVVNNGTVTNRKCRITEDVKKFRALDSNNFINTPHLDTPVILISSAIYVLPTSITAGVLDYIKVHPTISDSQATLFTELGDLVLLNKIVQEYYRTIPQRFDLADNIEKEIDRILNVNNIRKP